MVDLNISTKLPAVDTASSFVPKIQSQALQNSQKTDSSDSKDKVDQAKQKRQEVASERFADSNQKSSREELDETISQLNSSLQNIQRNLEFSVDKEVGMIVINVKDKNTDEVLRQIPSEEFLELARNLQDANKRLNEGIEIRSQPPTFSEGVFLKTKV